MARLSGENAFSATIDIDADLLHFVDTSDTTDDPAGSSFKLTPRQLKYGSIISVTNAQMLAISTPPTGLRVWNTTHQGTFTYNGAFWGCNDVLFTKKSLTSTQIKALNSTPLEVVGDPGSGYAIEALDSSMRVATYGTTPYATNTNMVLYINNKSLTTGFTSFFDLSFTSAGWYGESSTASGLGSDHLAESESLKVSVQTGDPTAGDSDVTIYVSYRLINV